MLRPAQRMPAAEAEVRAWVADLRGGFDAGSGDRFDDRLDSGLGSYFPEYVSDKGPGDALLPVPAQTNRTVRIEPCNPTCPPDSESPPA
jgi:hypothetical protein